MAYYGTGSYPAYTMQTQYPQYQNQQYSGTYPQGGNSQATSMRADWIQGEPAARAYPNSPGMITLLMDSDNPVLYVKMTDQTGRPMPLEVYDLVKRESYQQNQLPQWSGNAQPQKQVEYVQQDMSEYVKKTELQQMVTDAVKEAMQTGGQK